MVDFASRRGVLCSLLPAGLAVASGCGAQPRPAYFELRANDAVELTVVVDSDDADEPVYERSHSFESGDVLEVGKDTLQRPPYDVELRTNGERIWWSNVGSCGRLVVSVGDGEDVDVLEDSAC